MEQSELLLKRRCFDLVIRRRNDGIRPPPESIYDDACFYAR